MNEMLLKMLKRHEGFRGTPYQCSAGVWTFGYGFTFITEEEASCLLEKRVKDIQDALEQYSWFPELNDVRKAVIIDMVFNLGAYGFTGFKDTIKALKVHEYETAAREMLDSKWARQVGNRAVELAYMMEFGKYT